MHEFQYVVQRLVVLSILQIIILCEKDLLHMCATVHFYVHIVCYIPHESNGFSSTHSFMYKYECIAAVEKINICMYIVHCACHMESIQSKY